MEHECVCLHSHCQGALPRSLSLLPCAGAYSCDSSSQCTLSSEVMPKGKRAHCTVAMGPDVPCIWGSAESAHAFSMQLNN